MRSSRGCRATRSGAAGGRRSSCTSTWATYDESLYVDNSVLLTVTRRPSSTGSCGTGRRWRSRATAPAGRCGTSSTPSSPTGRDAAWVCDEQRAHYAAADAAALEEQTLWSGLLLRRHDDVDMRRAMTLWWEHVLRFSRRDQLSLPFVLRATALDVAVPRSTTVSRTSTSGRAPPRRVAVRRGRRRRGRRRAWPSSRRRALPRSGSGMPLSPSATRSRRAWKRPSRRTTRSRRARGERRERRVRAAREVESLLVAGDEAASASSAPRRAAGTARSGGSDEGYRRRRRASKESSSSLSPPTGFAPGAAVADASPAGSEGASLAQLLLQALGEPRGQLTGDRLHDGAAELRRRRPRAGGR